LFPVECIGCGSNVIEQFGLVRILFRPSPEARSHFEPSVESIGLWEACWGMLVVV
jgi:hypothetical protein